MKKIGSFLVLTFVVFVFYASDFWGLGLSHLTLTEPLLLLIVAVIDAAVLTIALRAAQDGGWSLAGRLALIIFGVKTAVVVVETVYLPDMLPLAWVPGLLVNGALTAVLLGVASVWLLGYWSHVPTHQPWFPWSTFSWKRWLLVGVLWLVLFIATGLLIFQPLARALDPAAADNYLAAFTPENPLLILVFQAVRGMLWALLAWPFLSILRGKLWQRGLILGLLFAGLMGSAQLQGINYLPEAIWPAHLAEVVIENMIFGFVVAWGLQPLPQPVY